MDGLIDKAMHELRLIPGLDWPTFIVRSWRIGEYIVGVEVFEPIGLDGMGGKTLFLIDGWTSSPGDSTIDIEKAEKFIAGRIKWDGCSDLEFGRDGNHFCSRAQAVRVGELLGKIYDIARETLKPDDVGMFDG